MSVCEQQWVMCAAPHASDDGGVCTGHFLCHLFFDVCFLAAYSLPVKDVYTVELATNLY